MINKVLDLGMPEPQETYSSSPHLYSDLDIPEGSKGRLPRAQQTREGLGAEVLEDLGETGKGAGRRGPAGGDRDRGGRGGRRVATAGARAVATRTARRPAAGGPAAPTRPAPTRPPRPATGRSATAAAAPAADARRATPRADPGRPAPAGRHDDAEGPHRHPVRPFVVRGSQPAGVRVRVSMTAR